MNILTKVLKLFYITKLIHLTMLLLATLPNFWHTFVMTQGNVPNLSLIHLIANILQEDFMRKFSPNNNIQT
jgi:hypothetical protein